MNIEIKRPDESYFSAIFHCLGSYRFHVFGANDTVDPDFPQDAILSVRNAICHVNLREKCWIAEQDGNVLGFCCWDWQNRDHLLAKTVLISVLTEARSLGVGFLLQRQRLDEMREHGAREVHTWSDDPKAIRWYKIRFGYKLIDYEPIYHCIHYFSLGERAFWGIHRGFVENNQLAHLVLPL
ncbi:MAG: GNAT family N-acetyltransferase [Chloroflexales bacterium]|nr:GNAT family N-acetyltransferase [Chloroflexales bacterium]